MAHMRRMRVSLCLKLGAVLLTMGCGAEPVAIARDQGGSSIDAGSKEGISDEHDRDAGAHDAGVPDAGVRDVAGNDGGSRDAGSGDPDVGRINGGDGGNGGGNSDGGSGDGGSIGEGSCTVPAMPSFSSLPSNAKLPDPFKLMDGSRMARKDQWTCRRAEISALAQQFELGAKPPKPSSVTASFSSPKLTVGCSEAGKSISFDATITYPSSGTAPYPAIIAVGGSSLDNNALSQLGVAIIKLPNDDIAKQDSASSRGQGKFYTLYGSSHSAGSLIAWAWGASRIIDALEQTPSARIDPKRLGVTGCSRNGKGALMVGAFDERIALTIPQESGSGGAASWRVSQAQLSSGQNVQTLSEIVGENSWFPSSFQQFGNAVDKLPFDHHEIAGLVAPRALLIIENTSMEWLGNLSTYTNGAAAHLIWEALGVPDRMGFSQVGNHNHCAFPSSQKPELSAFVQKYLLNGAADTTIFKTDGSFTFDKSKWVDWAVPSLQ
jgi:hypothetical protein